MTIKARFRVRRVAAVVRGAARREREATREIWLARTATEYRMWTANPLLENGMLLSGAGKMSVAMNGRSEAASADCESRSQAIEGEQREHMDKRARR